jgi:hypothetical protein
MVLGYAEQEVPALKVRASTAGYYALGVDFLDFGEGRIRRGIQSLATEFAVDRVMNTPEPTAESLPGLESGGERIGLIVFRQGLPAEFTRQYIRKHLKHLFYTLLTLRRVIGKCNKME